MKTTEVTFDVKSGQDGSVDIKYKCLYVHQSAYNHAVDVSIHDGRHVFQVGSSVQPEWPDTGHVFLRGSKKDQDDLEITRHFPNESTARTALWEALYGIRDFERRLIKHKVVPENADNRLVHVSINGQKFELDYPELGKFIAILR